ncbi:calcium-transporting P-type ATPase [Diplocarpon rosae]|nr:calcium-transporting P-type ATPase [Diplocarpon rosae]
MPRREFTAVEQFSNNRSCAFRTAFKTTIAEQTKIKSTADEYSGLSPNETAERLQTSLTKGLSPAEALARLHDQGPNELLHEDPEPLWLRFLKQFKEPLILLLLASALASVVVGNKDDAISITVAVTIVVMVGFIQEYRSEKSIEALSHLVPNHAHLIRVEPPRTSSLRTPPWQPGATDAPEEEILMNATVDEEATLEAASSKVMASQLVVGDLVLFTTGDRIPADIRVTKASDLTIDESNLTGENEPVRVTAEARPSYSYTRSKSNNLEPPGSPAYASAGSGTVGADTNLKNATNIAFMGTLVRSGHGQGIVYATGGSTHFGTIAASVTETESPRTPLQLSMDALGSQLSQASFAIIGVISFVGWLQGKGLMEIFTISISLAVAAIPEGLPIIVTVTLALGVHRMARQNAIVRKMPSVETLGSVNVVCSDKTGTLTMNHMTTTKMWFFGGQGPVDVDTLDDPADAKADSVTLRILRIGNIANNGRLNRLHQDPRSASSIAVLSSTESSENHMLQSRWVGQPTDVAMLDLLDRFKEHDVRDGLGNRIGETPFSSERKWMGVTVGDASHDPSSVSKEVAYIKGAVDRVLSRCDTYLTKEGREMVLDAARRQEALDAAEKLAVEGLRVLGFASGPVGKYAKPLPSISHSATPSPKQAEPHVSHSEDVYRGLVFAGLVGMSDPPRKGVKKSIRRLMRGGVKVIMITGDAETTALAIGQKLGMTIATPREHTASSVAVQPVLSGAEIDEMTDEELEAAIANTSIFARTSPDHKMKIIRALQARGDIVAMTGDGVNDAPALKKADIGISMGRQGTDVAKEAADMILTDDDFSTILKAIEEGKGIFNNIQNFLTFQLSTSAAALSLVFFCTCFGFKNPLNAMQILWISIFLSVPPFLFFDLRATDIIMDGPPAQSLGVEPVDPDVMTRPPRKRNAPVLTWPLITRVLTSATIIMLGTFAVYYHEMSTEDDSDVAGNATRSVNIVTKRDTTMTFTCFVLFDMFNALNCRSATKSVLRGEVGLFSNTLFNWAVSLSLGGQVLVIYFPWLQSVFQTEGLSLWDLISLIAIASSVFWVDEARKFLKGRERRGVGAGYSLVV